MITKGTTASSDTKANIAEHIMGEQKTRDELLDELETLRQRLHQAERELSSLKQALPAKTEQNQRLQTELNVLQTLTSITTQALDKDVLIERVTELIGETLYPDSFGVMLVDEPSRVLQTHPSYQGAVVDIPLYQGITGQVIRSGDNRNVPDVSQEPDFLALDPGIHSELCVPLKIGQRVIGVVNAESKRLHAFDEHDERLLVTIARQLAASFEKARLLSETTHALGREQQLNEMTRIINTAANLPTILANVVRVASELVEADAGLLGLIIDKQVITFYPFNIPRRISLRPVPKGRGSAWHIIESGQSIMLSAYENHPQAHSPWIKAGARAFIGVPVVSGEIYLGTLEIFSLTPEKQFSVRDLALVESVGRQAGIAIQNSRLLTEAKVRAGALSSALAKQAELDALKDRFVANMSHELRTPLGIIFGYAELLESGELGNLSSSQERAVQVIAGRARMLNNLVDDLSTLLAAETQEFGRETIDIAAMVATMALEFGVQAKKAGIILHQKVEKPVLNIIGDPTHLRRVFDNLVANAFKFTPAGGSVTISLWQEKGDVFIEVADTGIGIPEEQLFRIFERFYQVERPSKPRRKGTGLGLALVKEIVEAHRGEVSVTSQVDVGTTFRVRLPGMIGRVERRE